MKYLITVLCALAVGSARGQKMDSVKSGDVVVYYELSGKGEPIYLLSGGPGISPYGMRTMASELSKKNQVILVHQRGTGKSRVTVNEESIQVDNYCQDIRSIKKKLGHRAITLLGHSWGAMLSMHYATSYTSDVDRLILVSSGGFNLNFYAYFHDNIMSRLSEDDQNSVRVLEDLNEDISSLPSDSIARIQSSLLTEYVNIITKGYLYDKRNSDKLKLSEEDFDPRINRLMVNSLAKQNWDLKEKLEDIEIKTLIIQGRQDPIDLETARGINTVISGSELKILEQCGHFPWIEKPGDFYQLVNNFLNDE